MYKEDTVSLRELTPVIITSLRFPIAFSNTIFITLPSAIASVISFVLYPTFEILIVYFFPAAACIKNLPSTSVVDPFAKLSTVTVAPTTGVLVSESETFHDNFIFWAGRKKQVHERKKTRNTLVINPLTHISMTFAQRNLFHVKARLMQCYVNIIKFTLI